jgi:hypothetical protein
MKITRLLTNTIGTAMLAGALMLAPQAAQARVFVSVGFAPPAIPVYVQPACPGDGYIWTPGYWAYTDDGYEWVDGAWVLAPYTGALWTPGYWAYGPGGYFWNAGYWGPVVGYYGGINYGFGYFGVGFYGGYWNGGHFFYNREYNHFGHEGGFRNVYDQRVSGFDGRPGGASFTRGSVSENRGGTFNNAGYRALTSPTNRGGFGENVGQSGARFERPDQANHFSSGNEGRGGYNPSANTVAQNRGGFQQPVYNQARPGNSFSNARPAAPVSNYRPSQGSFSGGQRSAPAPAAHNSGNGGGGFHGGGGGSHGGRR